MATKSTSRKMQPMRDSQILALRAHALKLMGELMHRLEAGLDDDSEDAGDAWRRTQQSIVSVQKLVATMNALPVVAEETEERSAEVAEPLSANDAAIFQAWLETQNAEPTLDALEALTQQLQEAEHSCIPPPG